MPNLDTLLGAEMRIYLFGCSRWFFKSYYKLAGVKNKSFN